ncbi:RDD family protein [Arthrobacter sp. 35W]|uniref:RDD family protein n=1 Tax=Arthrobacter sp. 35W TaxID=1132441 RepID=UPI0004223C28|nr:RDD family protein [Arthrobacter sp. 35W]
MSAIITGEAVTLVLRPASFAARAVGSLIDVVATVLLGIGLLLGIGAVPGLLDAAAGAVLSLTTVVLLLVGLPVTVETLSRGRSLGKLAMGLRIVRDDGGSIRFRHALIRGLLGIFEIYMMFGSVAFLVSMFNDKSKRLGDMLAGTYAVRERVKAPPPLLVSTPVELAGWAALADMGRMPDGLARRISQLLRQGTQMTAASRDELARALATEAAAHVSPPPPAGTPPAAFLAAITAEHRRRDLHRLTAAQERAQTLGRRLYRLPFTDEPS